MIQPLFSVIVTAYNAHDNIDVCLRSVIDQNFPFIEIIVCDDGSEDDTREIVNKYVRKDERVRLIEKPHRGVAWERLACIQAAKSDYIVCLNSDDALEPNCLEEFAKVIDVSDPDIVCCGFRRVKDNSFSDEKIGFKPGLYSTNAAKQVINPVIFSPSNCNGLYMTLWAKAIRKDIILQEQMLLDPSITEGEDIAVCAACFYRAEGIYILDSCLYDLRETKPFAGDITLIQSPDQLVKVIKHWQDRIDFSDKEMFSYINKSIREWILYTGARIFIENPDFRISKDKVSKLLSNKTISEIVSDCHGKLFSNERKIDKAVTGKSFSYFRKEAKRLKKLKKTQ